MSTLDIHLPDELSRYLRDEAARRGYRDISQFVQSLLQAEQHRQLGQELEARLLEAVDGPFSQWSDDDVDEIRKTGKQLIERRRVG